MATTETKIQILKTGSTALETELLGSYEKGKRIGIPILFCHSHHQSLDLSGGAGGAGLRLPLPSYFRAISFRCQTSNVSGVMIVATSAKSFRPRPLALAVKRRR